MKRADDGFTLVEVLISLALLGLLTGLAYGTVRFASVSWWRVSAQREDEADRVAVSQLLRRALTRAYPAFASPDVSDTRIAFEGLPASISLIAPLPDAIEAGVMARERFYVDPNSRALMMVWALDLPSASGGILPPHFVAIAAAVRSMRVRYFGPRDASHGPAWQDQWTGRQALPALVRVTLWRTNNAAGPWIDILARPATTTATDCVYDPADIQCRRLE